MQISDLHVVSHAQYSLLPTLDKDQEIGSIGWLLEFKSDLNSNVDENFFSSKQSLHQLIKIPPFCATKERERLIPSWVRVSQGGMRY